MLLGLVFIFTNLVYCLITTIVYLSKKRINSIETKIYKVIMFSTLVALVLEMSCGVLIRYYTDSPLTYVINKAHIANMCFWITIFKIYIIVAGYDNKKYEMFYENNKYKIYIYILFISILAFVLPLEYYNEGSEIYTTGLAPSLIVILGGVYLLIDIFLLIFNAKKIRKKKIIPMIALFVGFGFIIFLRNISPALVFMSSVFTIVTVLMYHTIENPDMKLLEELHDSKEISDNANEEKTLFIYNLTQDIRNISGAIDDDADYILESKNWEQTYECARNIKFNSAKFTTMTNEILDISQVDSANIKTYNNKYNIKNILKQLVNVYGDLCENKSLKFRTNIDHDVPELLYGDGIGLKDVLNTILSNSVKYTEKGFVELSVNAVIKNDICRLIITIEDSGIGIKSEEINNIKVNDKSLSKANKLLTLMNGTMLISSNYGVGTKIKIILDQKIELVEDTEVSKYEDIMKDIKILAVDDSEAGLKIIEKLLKNSQAKLFKANTGKECIDIIKTTKFDLILLDEELSQITANELIVKIKAIRNFDVPVVLLTKDNSYEYNEEYIKNGFAGYILKPLKKETFISKINEYVKKINV